MSRQITDGEPQRGDLVYASEPVAYGPGSSYEPDVEAGPALAERLESLRRHAGKIGLFVAVCVVITGIYLLRQPKLYDATAVIRVDPSAPQQIVGQNNEAQPAVDNTALMSTEQSQVKSDDVVIPVINDLDLGHNSALNYTPPKPGVQPFLVEGIPHRLLVAVEDSLTVSRPPNTLLLNVQFRARSPQLAANVANAVAASMIRHDYQTRSDSLRASSQYLTSQVQDLRAKMEQSQKALTDYEQANDILSPDDKFNLLNQRLSTVATDLDAQTQAERKLAAALQLAQTGDVDDLMVSGLGDELRPLLDAYHAEQLQFAAIAAKYGPADPTYKEEQRRLAGDQAALQQATAHVAQQIQNEAAAQQDQAQLTLAAYGAQKQALEDYNARAAQYNLLQQQAVSQSKLYDDMLSRIQDADVAAGYHSNDLRIVETALPNPTVAYPKVGLSLLVAFLVSALLAVSAVFVISGLDKTFTDPSVVLAATGRPLIASLPLESDAAKLHLLWHGGAGLVPAARGYASRSSYSEAVHSLRASIFLGAGRALTSLAVTSAQPRDGKTTTTISLAAACARNGQKTLLLDADLRRPEVHRALELNNRVGLSTALQGRAKLESLVQVTQVPGLAVIPAGPSVGESAELLVTGFAAVLEELKARYDMVLVDCPPCLGFADAMIIGPTVDTVLIVARAASTPREYVRAAVEQLERVRADVAGVVLNGVSAQVNQYYRYYRSYTSYYRERQDDDDARTQSTG